MIRSAIIDGNFRTSLTRIWDKRLPLLVVCMLNPSTADGTEDDPTILTLIHFTKLWGYGGFIVVNLFSFRSPSPTIMRAAVDPIGPDNDEAFEIAVCISDKILVAWGNGGDFMGRDKAFLQLCRDRGVQTVCLGVTQSGQPKHPLARGHHRIPRDQMPLPWPMTRDLESLIGRLGSAIDDLSGRIGR